MATNGAKSNGSQVLVVGDTGGVTVIDPSTPLKRLNYFDGKFLRASDLDLEQGYLRQLVAISNQGLGPGVVYGYDTTLGGGDTIQIGPGLAIDPSGKVLLMQSAVTQNIQTLLDASRKSVALKPDASGKTGTGGFNDCIEVAAPPPTSVIPVSDIYVIAICSAEALCGQEDVYGKLCEEACITSTDRPFRLDGVVIRAIPLQLVTPFPTSKAVAIDSNIYLRSKVAHSWYSDEVLKHPGAISRDGLLSRTWCLGAGYDSSCCEVPLAVVARAGSTTVFLDAWIVRRERIDAPAKRYWQWKMRMRPWDVFLAQVLQFQCQLADVFDNTPDPRSIGDPCHEERQLIQDSAETIGLLTRFYEGVSNTLRVNVAALSVAGNPAMAELFSLGGVGIAKIDAIHKKLLTAQKALDLSVMNRWLIREGIVATPSAAYLPVLPAATTINKQVRMLLGEGLDLRFCVVRPDFVAHALEEAQHMERISLLEGLDDPNHKPEVDVLVPNGEIVKSEQATAGTGFEGRVAFLATPMEATGAALYKAPVAVVGAGRGEILETGGGAFHFAGATQAQQSLVTELGAELTKVGTVAESHIANLKKMAASRDATLQSGIIGHADPKFLTNVISASSRAIRYNASVLAAGQASGRVVPFDDKIATESRLVGLWLTMQCGLNPFEMEVHDSAPVKLETIIEMPGSDGVELNVKLQGDLRVDQAATTLGDSRKVLGRLSLFGSMQGTNVDKTTPLEIDVIIELISHAGQEPVLEVTLRYQTRIVYKISTQWSNGPILAKTAMTYSIGDRSIELLRSEMNQNNDVLLPNNNLHTLSLSALQVIGAALKDPGFAASAAKLLFPAPLPPSDEISIRGTLDWVLFHRRRNKQCAIVEEKPQVVTRRYQVYHAQPKDNKAFEVLRSALLTANVPKRVELGIEAVTQVEFGAGVPTLLSGPDAVLEDWKRVEPGNQLFYAAIATQGPGDGDALAIQRLASLEQVLSSVSALDPEVQQPNEVIPKVPESMNVPGTDGMIVLATRLVTSCVSVYAMIPGASVGRVLAENGNIRSEALNGLTNKMGDAIFKANTNQILDNSLQPIKTKWTGLAGGNPLGKAVVVFKKDAPNNAKAAYLSQAKFITAELGGAAVSPEFKESPSELPDHCPAVLLLETGQANVRKSLILLVPTDIENESHRIFSPDDMKHLIVEFKDNVLQGNTLEPFMRNLGTDFFRIQLAIVTGAPDAAAQKRLDAVRASSIDAGRVPTTITTLSQFDSDQLRRAGFQLADIDEVIFIEHVG
jgi:hypothetical protein